MHLEGPGLVDALEVLLRSGAPRRPRLDERGGAVQAALVRVREPASSLPFMS